MQSDANEKLQHVAYFDEGEFHWMSGIAPRDCELYTRALSAPRTPSEPVVDAVGWEACRIGSCQRHGRCMYHPCRNAAPVVASDLEERLGEEADLCRNDGADDIAHLLDEAAKAIRALKNQGEGK